MDTLCCKCGASLSTKRFQRKPKKDYQHRPAFALSSTVKTEDWLQRNGLTIQYYSQIDRRFYTIG